MTTNFRVNCYVIRWVETGDVINGWSFTTLEDALKTIKDFEEEDKLNECYTANTYEVVKVELIEFNDRSIEVLEAYDSDGNKLF